jgi:hypothetical protein
MVRPPSSISASTSNNQASTSATTLEMMPPVTTTSQLSVRFADSLSEIVDQSKAAFKAMDESKSVLQTRMQERWSEMQDRFTEAFDVLDDVLGQAMEESRGRAHEIRDALVYRNNRAKSNAVLLKEKGKQLLMDKTDHARQRAKSLVSQTMGDGGGGGRERERDNAVEGHAMLPRMFM